MFASSRFRATHGWLALAIVGGGLLIRLAVAPSYGYLGREGDLLEQKQATHRALTLGVHEVYTPNAVNDPALAGGEWMGGYFINYPPVIVYLRYVPGAVYRWAAPAAFDLWNSELNFFAMRSTDLEERLARSRGFTVAMKLPGILADVLISLGLLVFVSRRKGIGWGLAASAFYAFNPGIILITAHWGQHDAVWVGLLVLSILAIDRGWVEVSWIAYALAALTKPQAGAFLFFIVFLGLSRAPVRRVAVAGGAAIATFVVVFLPFLVHGTFVTTVRAIVVSVFGGEPFVSCNAANFWWLCTAGHGYEVSDVAALVGPISARKIGMTVYLVANALALWRLGVRRRGAEGSFLAAAFLWMTFFTFSTELHENHMMAVVPLLAFALPVDRRIWLLLAPLSLTLVMNLVLFDRVARGAVAGWLGLASIDPGIPALTAAAVNVTAWAALAWLFWSRTASGEAG